MPFLTQSLGVLYNGSAGRIDPALGSRPWSADTFTHVASLTKIITATSIMQIVERGLVSLDADMRELVPRLGQMPILRGFTEDEKPILEDHDVPITLRYSAASLQSYILHDNLTQMTECSSLTPLV